MVEREEKRGGRGMLRRGRHWRGVWNEGERGEFERRLGQIEKDVRNVQEEWGWTERRIKEAMRETE